MALLMLPLRCTPAHVETNATLMVPKAGGGGGGGIKREPTWKVLHSGHRALLGNVPMNGLGYVCVGSYSSGTSKTLLKPYLVLSSVCSILVATNSDFLAPCIVSFPGIPVGTTPHLPSGTGGSNPVPNRSHHLIPGVQTTFKTMGVHITTIIYLKIVII